MAHVLVYSDDSPSCLVCGAGWIDADSYADNAGDCSGNTSQCHHYVDECPNDVCNLESCTCNLCG